MPSVRWICSSETPLVSGRNARTMTNCRTIIAAKKANARPPDASAMIGKVQLTTAAQNQWVKLPSAWPTRPHAVREDLADEDPDHRALRESEEGDVADQAAEHEHRRPTPVRGRPRP